ncbi:MAG: tRNA uridine-5-carboxymethylaminomethyl(34) synthesis enzyme MnmG [Candidatus Latescibacteria bacterium]|nr:tRNA uridine-5-carboxymethylaminomethyl(34) synthesis enzyme MnmG [Candidatus Latescibacterota bacterium]
MSVFEVIVIGGGHAGIEAALAAARLGARTALVTHDRREIGRMPCNPAVGGLGKGHLVREIDALGGEMGRAIDATGIQFRVLNRSKGPAVRAPRAQADKHAYQARMSAVVGAQPGLTVVEGDAVDLLIADTAPPTLRGVVLADGRELLGPRAVLATGTFLGGLMHVGDERTAGGREGAAASLGLSGALARLGFELRRLKTGTPPRLWRDSLDFARLEVQPGDEQIEPFSFITNELHIEQVPCHLTWTGERTHALIRDNLHRSPLYGGIIEGTGPRYCPSIEDKVVRFADKERHLVFLEPEGRDSEEIYVNGLSTSLPRDVQDAFVRTLPGLERAVLARHGYAVEYDSAPSWQVRATLESRPVAGLYLAGQILGTSGYEEAAAQGLAAGVNAVRSLGGREALDLPREDSYLGVLLDDLTTKDITEPYRMFTSRAERRLALRCDNAASRLLPTAAAIGLLSDPDLRRLRARVSAAERAAVVLRTLRCRDPQHGGSVAAADLVLQASGGLDAPALPADIPVELRQAIAAALLPAPGEPELPARLVEESLLQAAVDLRYEGYIAKQDKLLARQNHLGNLELPEDLPYQEITTLSKESREKLARLRPANLGRAARIDGVRASDLAVLSVLASKWRDSRELP